MDYKITYKSQGGTTREFYIKAENSFSAVVDFRLRTGEAEESIISVEVYAGGRWQKVR